MLSFDQVPTDAGEEVQTHVRALASALGPPPGSSFLLQAHRDLAHGAGQAWTQTLAHSVG